jgi:hypothetical protein
MTENLNANNEQIFSDYGHMQIEALINKMANKFTMDRQFYMMKNCMNNCVHKFDTAELAQSERLCLEKCYLNSVENMNANSLK